jgi:LuxR family maltose regulon positive regulatory protein
MLREGLARPLTLISAPAGFGKTTLLSEWCASEAGSAYPLAWLSLDADDNDPSRFLTYVIAALQTVRRETGAAALAALRTQPPPPPETLLKALLPDLGLCPGPFALALDDYQAIADQAVHRLVRFLLEHMPPQMHLILLTRLDPPLPLARLRAGGQLAEIRMQGLRFLPEEAAAFLNGAMGLDLSAADVTALDARTEGWIAGLQLAAFSLRQQADRHAFVAAFAGDDRYIMDYLLEEVLHRQSQNVQDFLLKTSILDRLCAALCEAVTGAADSREILAHLEQANLFVVPLDNRRHWYRYHQLFADLLRRRLQQTVTPPQLAELTHLACAWYGREGLVAEAISLALAAREFEQAADLLERHVLEVFFRGETRLVHSWLKALPEAVIRSRALLCAAYANTIAHTGLFQPSALEQTAAWLDCAQAVLIPDRAAAGARQGGDPARDFIALSRAYLALWQGAPPATVIELARQALAGLPTAEGSDGDSNSLRLRAGLTNNLGISYLALGDEEAASQAFEQAERIGKASGDLLNAYSAVGSRCRILRRHGQLHEAAALCRDALGGSEEALQTPGQAVPYVGVVYVALGRIQYEWNDLESAEPALVRGVGLGELAASRDYQLEGCLALARLKQARADPVGATRVLDQLEAGPARIISAVAACRARLHLARAAEDPRSLAKALDWARGRSLDDPDSGQHGTEALTLARVLLASSSWAVRPPPSAASDLERVLRFLEAQIRAAEASGWTERLVEALILQSLGRQAGDETEAALEALQRALALAAPGSYIRTFADEGLPMQRLLARLKVEDPMLREYQGRLLAACGAAEALSASGAGLQPLVDPLSARELEVLRLLADGASNADIARKLVISLNTTKKHITHIFEKLGVTDRGDAARRGKELGLVLPPRS